MTVDTISESIIELKFVESFVGESKLEDTVHCLNVIDYAEQQPELWNESMTVGGNDPGSVNKEFRDSSQINYPPNHYAPCHKPVLEFAGSCLDSYIIQKPEVNNFGRYGVRESFNVIKYEPGQAYHSAHSDYAPFHSVMERRHLTFIMFLNSVADGGELEFVGQNLKITPEEGKAVIFPSGWTHSHRSLPASETRYIFQLWWSFLSPGESLND